MSALVQSCYACDRPGVTVEHVPPKCLFPESAPGTTGSSLRKELITVPSCPEHNGAKSKDDEYLRFVLAGNIFANEHAAQIVETKITRSVNRNPGFRFKLVSEARPVLLRSVGDERTIEADAVPLDWPRLEHSLTRIAQGLYFAEFGERWSGRIRVVANFGVNLDGTTPESAQARAFLNAEVKAAFECVEWKGKNPEVFRYAFRSDFRPAAHVARLAFYGSCVVSVFYFSDS